MSNENLTIECRQQNAISVYNNGDFNSKIVPFNIYEGDELTLDKVFIDTEAQEDQKVHIEEDINIFFDFYVYNFNWNIPQTDSGSGASNDKTFDNAGHLNDGYEYILASKVTQTSPQNAGYVLYTQFTIFPKGINNGDSYGGNAVLNLNYIDLNGKQVIASIIATDTTYDHYDNSSHSIIINAQFYAKKGGMGSAGLVGMDRSFSVENPTIWNNNHCDQSSAETTGTGTIQHDIFTPRLFTKEISLSQGKYDPNELTTILNNKMTDNVNFTGQGFTQSSIIDNPFLQESGDNTQIQETFNIYINKILFTEDSSDLVFQYTTNHTYFDGQNVTITGLPTGDAQHLGVPMNQFNASLPLKDFGQTINTLQGGEFTLTAPDGATADSGGVLIGMLPIYIMTFTAGSPLVTVRYKFDQDVPLTNAMAVRVITNKNTTFAGVNTTTQIDNVTHNISSIIARDPTSKEGSFKITLGANATETGTLGFRQIDDVLTGINPDGKGGISLLNTVTTGTATTTETTQDFRYLTRYDGLMTMNFSKTYTGAPSSNYWIGSSQMELAFDSPTSKYKWIYNHGPIYDSGKQEVLKIEKDGTPGRTDPYFYANRNGGVIFHNLRAETVNGKNTYDFWNKKLGFDVSKLCMSYKLEIKTLSIGNQHIGVFSKPILGQHITGQRPTIDSLVNKGSSFESVPSVNNFPDTEQTLTIEIFADELTTDNDNFRFGYFYIEVQGGFNTALYAEDGKNGIEVRKNLMGIINNYYSLGGFTSAEGGGVIYKHTGEPLHCNSLRLRILKSDKTLDTKLGEDNSIFFSLTRGPNSLMIDDNFEGKYI